MKKKPTLLEQAILDSLLLALSPIFVLGDLKDEVERRLYP